MIVERHNHNYQGFTKEGKQVLERARRIVADCDAMQQEASAMHDQLTGTLSVGVVPSALPLMASLTTRFQSRYPGVAVNVLARSSMEIQRGLDDFDLEAGISYIDNEPLKNVRHVAMYDERYVLLTGNREGLHNDSETISWADAAALPLCLLTSDMQNRRIIDGAFQAAGVSPIPEMETNSILALYSHVVAGRLATILPEHFLKVLAAPVDIRAVQLVQPHVSHKIGLLIADREPAIPVAESLFDLVSQSRSSELFSNDGSR